MDIVQRIAMKRAKDKKWLKKIEEFTPGDTLKVFVRIKEVKVKALAKHLPYAKFQAA
jgi:ribosomal protein L19